MKPATTPAGTVKAALGVAVVSAAAATAAAVAALRYRAALRTYQNDAETARRGQLTPRLETRLNDAEATRLKKAAIVHPDQYASIIAANHGGEICEGVIVFQTAGQLYWSKPPTAAHTKPGPVAAYHLAAAPPGPDPENPVVAAITCDTAGTWWDHHQPNPTPLPAPRPPPGTERDQLATWALDHPRRGVA